MGVNNLPQCRYLAMERSRVELATSKVASQRLNKYTTGQHILHDPSVLLRSQRNEHFTMPRDANMSVYYDTSTVRDAR